MRAGSEQRGVAIRVDGAVKRFDGRVVLADVAMEVAAGEFFTLLGPSGCGKTTLLRAIAGYHPLDAGLIFFGNADVTALPPWERHVGFVFQNYALWPDKTVFENVAYGLRTRKRPEQEVQARVRKALGLVRLTNVEKKAPGALSGGMQQRAALARALVVDPPLMLFDEPLSNLDAALRVHLRRDIRAIQRELGTTSIYVTHDQEEALEISDRIAVMHEGRLAQVADPETIYERPLDETVARFVGTANLLPGRRRGAAFRIDDGDEAIPIEAIVNAGSLGEGDTATLLVRPEWLRVEAAGPLIGRVAARHYAGAVTRYELDTATGRRLVLDTEARLVPQESLALSVRTGWLLPASIRRQVVAPNVETAA